MNSNIFIEAETFADPGGWTIDTQSYEALGFFYMLAHGIGKPVQDAVTSFKTENKTLWHVYAHTRDWTAIWNRGTPAGRFQILINGDPLESVLGTNGTEWNWQKAGTIELDQGVHTVALHDLTGFDGRCDAVFLTADPDFVPPNEKAELTKFRRELCQTGIKDDPEFYDLLICGGGYAGLCAGIAAKKKGLKFKIIQNRPVVGGCGSSEIRVWTGGKVNLPPYPELGNVATMLSPIKGDSSLKKDFGLFEDFRKSALFVPEKELILNEAVVGAETDPENPGKITAVITRSVRTGEETRRKAGLFADCTGDAVLAKLTGCTIMYGSEGRDVYGESLGMPESSPLVMGHSTLWETRECDHDISFPDIDWGIEFNDSNALERFNCCWDWETGQYRDQITEIEYIRDYGLMTCFANWSFLKNRSKRKEEWRNMDLEWISAIGGKRESRRVVGDLILTQNDIENKIPYEDGTGSITWSIDLHFPDPANRKKFGEAFQSCAYHRGIGALYPVPYRCLYARDVENLFLGGRCLSLSHVAFSCVRVMRTLGMLGEVIGMAAEICVKKGCSPREVYSKYLDELKESMKKGVPMDPPFGWMPGCEESYHFMRPAGIFGNKTENCWYHFDDKGNCVEDIPDEIRSCMQELAIIHKYGDPFQNTQKKSD